MTMETTWKSDEGELIRVRTCGWSPPGDHPVGCGMFIYTNKDGKFVKVEGDPDHPISQGRLCPRCLAMKDFIESPNRIRYPMKRAREDRGKDAWERITWDEALDILEREVRKIWANYGPEAIYLFQGTGREATLYAPPMAQACFKTPNCSFSMSGGSCYGPRTVVADFLLGRATPSSTTPPTSPTATTTRATRCRSTSCCGARARCNPTPTGSTGTLSWTS